MDSVGQLLRREREGQKRNLSEIAKQTCIGTMYLSAIEGDDIEALPGFFFYKSFVKQYAAALGVDYSVVERQVDAAESPTAPDVLPALNQNYQPVRQDAVRSYSLTRHAAVLSAATVVLVMVAAAGTYSWWRRGFGKAEGEQLAERTIAVRADAAPAEAAAKVDAPAAPVAEPVPDAATPTTDAPAKQSVNISAKEKTWVSLKSKGKTVFRGVLAARESRDLEIADRASLTTGNAAGLEVRFNGKPVGPIGSRGQVRTILFTQGNFEIRAGNL
jgi:cytoskeletal protein RodZ